VVVTACYPSPTQTGIITDRIARAAFGKRKRPRTSGGVFFVPGPDYPAPASNRIKAAKAVVSKMGRAKDLSMIPV